MTQDRWNFGDLFSIGMGLVVLAVTLAARPQKRNIPAATVVLASGMSIGPLLLVLIDPISQLLAGPSLLHIVVEEGRGTLWWAAFVASLYIVRDLL